jgi:hypothetical protein
MKKTTKITAYILASMMIFLLFAGLPIIPLTVSALGNVTVTTTTAPKSTDVAGVWTMTVDAVFALGETLTVDNVTYTNAGAVALPANEAAAIAAAFSSLTNYTVALNGAQITFTQIIPSETNHLNPNSTVGPMPPTTGDVSWVEDIAPDTTNVQGVWTLTVDTPFNRDDSLSITNISSVSVYTSSGGLTVDEEAERIRTALSIITGFPYSVSGAGADIILTQIIPDESIAFVPEVLVEADGLVPEPLPRLRFNGATDQVQGFLNDEFGDPIPSVNGGNIQSGTFMYTLNYKAANVAKAKWYPIYADSLDVGIYISHNRDFEISIISRSHLQLFKSGNIAPAEFRRITNMGRILLPRRAAPLNRNTFQYNYDMQVLGGIVAPELGGSDPGHEIKIQDNAWVDGVTFNSNLTNYPFTIERFPHGAVVQIRVQGLYNLPNQIAFFSAGTDTGTGGVLSPTMLANSNPIRIRIRPQPKAPRVQFIQPTPVNGIWKGLNNRLEIIVARENTYNSPEEFLNVVNNINRFNEERQPTPPHISVYNLGEICGNIRNISTRELNDRLFAAFGIRLEPGDFVAVRTKAREGRSTASFPVIVKLPRMP